MKVAVYTRVSTDKTQQNHSYELQKEVYEEYCKQRGYDLIEMYADKGTGMHVRNRGNFVRMMTDAGLDYKKVENGYDTFVKSKRKPKFELIIIKDVSRMSRNMNIGMTTVEYLRDKGVYVLFENAGLNTKDDDWHMRLSMLFTMAQNESHSLSRRVKFSRKHNNIKGKYNPSRLSYGYERNEKNEIVVKEDEAEVVKRIFELYKVYGASVISKMLNEEGKKSQNGYDFSPDKVLRIIRNKLYCGIAVVNKSTRENVTDTHRIIKPKDEWIEIPNAVEPIISFSTWSTANIKRKSRTNTSSKRGRKPAINDEFHGKIYCEECGSRFVRHQGRNNPNSQLKLSYMCQSRRKKGTTKCSTRGIAFNVLNDMLDQIDVTHLFNNIGDSIYYQLLMDNLGYESKNMQRHIDDYTAKIEALEKENEKIANGLIEHLSGGSQATIDILSNKIEANKKEIDKLALHRSKFNVETIEHARGLVEAKRLLIKEIKNNKVTRERKLNLIKEIRIRDYEVTFEFFLPSYEEEIDVFNSLFPSIAIEEDIEYRPFWKTIRREHKEAREYWAERESMNK
ncbi:recombinase family protein [Sporosarcina saromensis]|uniref:Recombinase family protein n=1 Tax=Sporosarcina saromensis TaxID=359365 RepID=A0ABU4G760_9BACL|nr:recombinase family protein [Sporosarcina saromensis]MDW0112148.1 recombinase family protein [Sporosarcina saromensis]